MSSENRWIRFQPFDRLVPPLKMTLSPASCCDDAQRLRNVVILFDDRLTQAARAEVFRRPDDGLLEVRVLKKPHGILRSFACHSRRVRQRGEIAEIKPGEGI